MPHLKAFLNLLAILAIAQALVKVLEIALDSGQKLAFQRATEKLTLKLIDLDPIRHYQRLREHKVQLKWLAVVSLFAWALTLFISFQDVGFDFRGWWRAWWPSRPGDFWLAASILSIPVVLYLPFRLILWWLGRSRDVWIMLIKAAILGLIFSGAVVGDRYNVPLLDAPLFTWIFGLCFYTAAIVALLYLAQGAVWMFRHVMWRIATDAKGAWSASLFLIAALLAVAATLVPKP